MATLVPGRFPPVHSSARIPITRVSEDCARLDTRSVLSTSARRGRSFIRLYGLTCLDGYLLDTCFLSALLDARHDNYEASQRANDAIKSGEPRYVSRITIAELTFGFLLDEAATGRRHPKAAEILRRAQEYKILEVTKHTATEYANIRKKLAVTYL